MDGIFLAGDLHMKTDHGDQKTFLGEHTSISSVNEAVWSAKGVLFWLSLFSGVINLLMLTGPLFMLQVYDRVLPSGSFETLVVLFGIVVFLYLIFGLLDWVRSRILTRFGMRIANLLRPEIMEGVVRLDIKTGGALAATRPLQDLKVVQNYYSSPAFNLRFDAPWTLIFVGAIFLLHVWLGAYSVASIILLVAIAMFFHDSVTRRMERAEKISREMARIADESRNTAEETVALGMTGNLRRRWLEKHDRAQQAAVRVRDGLATLSANTRTLRLALQSGILALGAWLAMNESISSGGIVAASIMLGRALQPIDQLIAHLRTYSRFKQARENLDAFLSQLPPPRGETPPVESPEGHMAVRNLAVFPPAVKTPVLEGVDFEVRPGQVVAIIGDSGVGKTSLLRTLAGVWPVQENFGRVELDGVPLDHWPEELRGRITGYVSQQPVLFDDTVAANIARLDPEPSVKALHRAVQRSGMEKMIHGLGGYDFRVGPGGARLSGGQRYLIALVRALYGNPRILLLDEPLASLDVPVQKQLVHALRKLRKEGLAILVSTHNPMLVDVADKLLVLNFGPEQRGRQVSFGTKAEILQRRQKLHTTRHFDERS